MVGCGAALGLTSASWDAANAVQSVAPEVSHALPRSPSETLGDAAHISDPSVLISYSPIVKPPKRGNPPRQPAIRPQHGRRGSQVLRDPTRVQSMIPHTSCKDGHGSPP